MRAPTRANLLLARATARRHELSVRLALGASRGRLARQLLGESLVLSGLGAALGLVFAKWFSGLLVRQLSTTTNNVHLELTLDWRVLAFTAAVAIATAVIFGTVPAMRATRVDPNDAIRKRRARDRRTGPVRARQPAGDRPGRAVDGADRRRGLVPANVQLACDAPARIRSAARPRRCRQPSAFATRTRRARGPLLEAARRPPRRQVQHAALSVVTPMSGSTVQTWLEPRRQTHRGRRQGRLRQPRVARLVQDLRTRLIAGRDFTSADKPGAVAVAIVNEAFARKFTGSVNPIGRTVREPSRPSARTPSARSSAMRPTPRIARCATLPPTILPAVRAEPDAAVVCVDQRAGGDRFSARPDEDPRSAFTAVNSGVAITFRPIEDQIDAALTQERLVATLSGFFGVLALLLAALGSTASRRTPSAAAGRKSACAWRSVRRRPASSRWSSAASRCSSAWASSVDSRRVCGPRRS